MRKLLPVLSAVVILSISNISMVFADGNPYGPYNPYIPHTPVDTGFEDVKIFYIIAGIVFVLGMGFLTTAKILKNKLSLQK